MTATTKSYRYQLPTKAVKIDCPNCGPRHKKTLSRYIDTQTGDPLPEPYGRCDRESNCGYHLSPYHKGPSGMSYHDEQKAPPLPKDWFRLASKQKRNGVSRQSFIQILVTKEGATPEQAERVAAFVYDRADIKKVKPKQIYCIPDDLFRRSLGHYNQNQFGILLARQFGKEVAQSLLDRFQIGTSTHWPGACVFWYIDEQSRIRSGQIKLFDQTFHTAKYTNSQCKKCSRITWVHTAYAQHCKANGQPYPDWLTEYLDEKNEVDKSPCLFGLPQLATAPVDMPIAIVEAPKTAVVCTYYSPEFIWMAIGSKSYLNAERLAPLKGRKICLFPDLNAYDDLVNEKEQVSKGWLSKSKELLAAGFDITVNDFLERQATDEQRANGLDLADFYLEPQVPENITEFIGEFSQDERIGITVTNQGEPLSMPQRVPALIQHYWTLFAQPPLCWNRWAALRYIREWVEPIPETVSPVADESQIERLAISDEESVAVLPEALLTSIEPTSTTGNYFLWQNSPQSPFNQLGLSSLIQTQPWRQEP